MADLQSRLSDKPLKNVAHGPGSDRHRPRIRKRHLKGANNHNRSDVNSNHPHTNPPTPRSRSQRGALLQKPFNRYPPYAYETGSNPTFEVTPDTPTNTTPRAKFNASTSKFSPSSSLLSRLSTGSARRTNTYFDDTPAIPSLMDRITVKVEDMEHDDFQSTVSNELMSSEQPQMEMSTVDVQSPQNGYSFSDQTEMDMDVEQSGEIITKPSLTNLSLDSAVMQDELPADIAHTPFVDNHSASTAPNNHSHSLLHNQFNGKVQPQPDAITENLPELALLIESNVTPARIPNTSSSELETLVKGSPISKAAIDPLLQPDVELDLDPESVLKRTDDPTAVLNLSSSVELHLSEQFQTQQQSQTTERNDDQLSMALPTLADQCRNILLPLMFENVKRRPECVDGQMQPQKVEDVARDMLTDQLCDLFIGKAKAVQLEMQTKRERDDVNGDHKQDAERSSDVQSEVGLDGDNRVCAASGEDVNDKCVRPDTSEFSISSSTSAALPAEVPGTSASETLTHSLVTSDHPRPAKNPPRAPKAMLRPRALDASLPARSSTAIKVEPALPGRPQWKGKMKAGPDYHHEDHQSSTRKSKMDKRLYHDDLFISASESRSDRDILRALPMRSDSAPGLMPPAPPLPYDEPQQQTIAIPLEPQFFTSPPSSSTGTDGRMANSFNPDRYSHDRPRRSSRSLSPRGSLPLPHYRPRGYSPPRRNHSPRSQRRRSPSPYYNPHVSRRSHRSRSHSRSRYLDEPSESSVYSGSYSDLHVYHTQTSISSPVDTPEDQKPIITQTFQTPPTPPSSASIHNPCHNVPGLWFVKVGLDRADILVCSLDVDTETAIKWELTDDIHSIPPPRSKRKPRKSLSLHLLCLPTRLVAATYRSLDLNTATVEGIATAISNIKTEWPPKGKLVVEVNPECDWGRRWLPINLDPESPPLNVSNCIRAGTNTFRFIQLGGLSEYLFVLLASPSSALSDSKRQRPDPTTVHSPDRNQASEVTSSPVDLKNYLALAAMNRSSDIGVFKFHTIVKHS